MTHTALMNWEIFLDAAGVCCCVLTVLYLIRLKRKAAFRSWISDPTQQENVGPFKASPMDLPENISFDGVLTTVKKDYQLAVVAGGRGHSADPYDEVRRLLDLGMEPHQIAERMKIPQCEIDLMASLRQTQPDPVLEKGIKTK